MAVSSKRIFWERGITVTLVGRNATSAIAPRTSSASTTPPHSHTRPNLPPAAGGTGSRRSSPTRDFVLKGEVTWMLRMVFSGRSALGAGEGEASLGVGAE